MFHLPKIAMTYLLFIIFKIFNTILAHNILFVSSWNHHLLPYFLCFIDFLRFDIIYYLRKITKFQINYDFYNLALKLHENMS